MWHIWCSGSGTSGSSGTSGGSGTSGSAGTSGLTGTSGSSGVTGTSGLSGDRYKTTSVYIIYIRNWWNYNCWYRTCIHCAQDIS